MPAWSSSATPKAGDAIGQAVGPNRAVYSRRCQGCTHRQYEHEDDGVCDLCDCDGFEED